MSSSAAQAQAKAGEDTEAQASADAGTPDAPAQADEAIEDPELAGAEPAAEAPAASDVIEDPELAGLTEANETATPAAPNGQMRLLLHSRFGVDTAWRGTSEDVLESTTIALFEARVRRSERLRFEVGVRARYLFASQAHAANMMTMQEGADAGPRRYEFDLAPTAAYADATITDGLHLRAGYQGVRLGRFDVLNPSDILSTYDLRNGVATMPDANEIAQPALRVDWDPESWLSLTAIGVPFFAPHTIRALQGDYALFPAPRDAFTAAYGPGVGALLRDTLSRTQQGRLQDGAFSAFTPDPNLKNPQAALRLMMHGTPGELGATAGTALEHLPSIAYTSAFAEFARACQPAPAFVGAPGAALASPAVSPPRDAFLPSDCALASNAIAADAVNGRAPFSVGYPRYELLSIDGATGVGPVQLGAELAYMFGRAQFSIPETAAPAGTLPTPLQTDVAHAGVRAEWVRGETWVIAVEASADRALKAPPDGQRYLFMTHDRWLLAALAFATMDPFEIGLVFELGGAVLNGPTFLLAPRVEQRIVDRLYVELGAYLLTGKTYPITDPRVTLGQLYSGTNQVYLGVRWQP